MNLLDPKNSELNWIKYKEKLKEINVLLDFVDTNILNEHLQSRYIKVLRHQKALIRDMDRKGRKIPDTLPSVCEVTGVEVNTIREKEPPFRLEENVGLFEFEPPSDGIFLSEKINSDIEHNSYSHLLNNYSLKAVKKMLGRKIVLDDLSSIEDNLTLIIELFKHRKHYKKHLNIKTFENNLEDIMKIVNEI